MVKRWNSPFKQILGFALNIGVHILAQLFLYPVEKFLCMTSNLGSTPASYVLFNFFPIYPKQTHRYNSNK